MLVLIGMNYCNSDLLTQGVCPCNHMQLPESGICGDCETDYSKCPSFVAFQSSDDQDQDHTINPKVQEFIRQLSKYLSAANRPLVPGQFATPVSILVSAGIGEIYRTQPKGQGIRILKNTGHLKPYFYVSGDSHGNIPNDGFQHKIDHKGAPPCIICTDLENIFPNGKIKVSGMTAQQIDAEAQKMADEIISLMAKYQRNGINIW